MSALPSATDRVLADLTAHPGASLVEIATRLGLHHTTVGAALARLRTSGEVVPVGTLVPLVMSADGPGWFRAEVALHMYRWACDVVGTPQVYADVHRVTLEVARHRASLLRRHGLLAPTASCWTVAQVEAAQDAAWPSVAA